MTVLMITNRYGESARGGAEQVIARLVRALEEQGHTVRVHVRTTLGFRSLHRMPTLLRVVWHGFDLLNGNAAVRLFFLLRRMRPDVVHTHNLIGCGGLTPLVIRWSGVRWVHTLHDVQLITPSGLLDRDGKPSTAIERSSIGRWFRALRRALIGSPDMVTSPSRWLLALHRGERFFPKSRDVVIGNPSPTVRSTDARPRSGAVRSLLFIGQIEGQKGIVLLIEAFTRLRVLFPDIALQVIGDGRAAPLLKRLARERRGLALRGRLDAASVATALAHTDLVIVPSLCAENQPSVILEAFAAGVPVVASRIGGIPELVDDGVTGWLVDPGSVDDLLRALRYAIEAPQAVRAMRAACLARAAAQDVGTIAQQLIEVYTSGNQEYARSETKPMG